MAIFRIRSKLNPEGDQLSGVEIERVTPKARRAKPKIALPFVKSSSKKAKRKAAEAEAARQERIQARLTSRSGGQTCPLCGEKVRIGSMLSHKAQAHGEAAFDPKQKLHRGPRSPYVRFISGGAPGSSRR